MKIGEFSKKYNVSIDTVRHYMDLELIIPVKVGGHYQFDASCSRDLEEVLSLKKLNFTLAEIQKLFSYKRLTDLRTVEDRKYYKSFLYNKKAEMVEEKSRINRIVSQLDRRIEQIRTEKEHSVQMLGMPLGFVEFLTCPDCKCSLNLTIGEIEDNMIMKGIFKCRCGFELSLQEGILLNTHQNRVIAQKDYVNFDNNIKDYSEKTSFEFINFKHGAIESMLKKADIKDNYYPVILELGTGSGFLLKRVLEDLHEDSFYIVTDIALERIQGIKSYLEKNSKHKKFVFICSDFLEMPVKKRSVDLVLDYLGTTCYNFEKEGYLIEKLDDVMKPGGKWIGCYFCFRPCAKSLAQYPEEVKPYFYKSSIVNSLENARFGKLGMEILGPVYEIGEYEPFFVEGDELYGLLYFGEKRWG